MQTPTELLKKFYAMGQKHEKEQDMKAALRCYNWAAEKGCLDSQLALGKMHEEGKGTEIDVKKAFACYKDVADKHGDNTALFKVGCAYFNGETAGAPQNLALAIEYLEKIPVEKLPPSGELILGVIHYYAREIKNHKPKAFAYLWTAVEKLTPSTNIENQTMAHAYLGAIFLDEESANKSLHEANRNIYRAFSLNQLTAPITTQLIDIVKNAIAKLSIVDHLCLLELILGKRTTDHLPCSREATYTFSEKTGFQVSLYIEELFKKLDNKEILTEEEQIIENTLVDYEARMTILSPEQALKLAIEELNQTKMRKNFLTRFLSISENGDGVSLYYKGLCLLANYIEGYNGIDFIKRSAEKKCQEAIEYMKLFSQKETPNHLAILLQAGKNAQEKGIYQIAKFHYSKAKPLILSRDKKNLKEYLQQIAVLEATLGDLNTAKNHFNTLFKMCPDDMNLRYKAMELYTKKDHLDEAIQLLRENKTLLKRLTQESIEENVWQYTLYGTHALSEAQNLFAKNDMKQGILLVKSAAATGFVPAKLKLALCYLEGWGVTRNLQEAWQCFHAIKTEPAAAYYLGILSVCKIGSNKTEKKLQDYFNGFSSELITDYLAKGTSAEGLITLGNKAFEQNMYRVAILHYTAANERDPGNTNALLKRSLCYIKWAEWDIALPMLKEVLQKEPANEEAILAKLQCLTLQNKLDKAVALLKDNQSLYVSAIASCQDKRSWQKTLCLAFEKNLSMKVPVPVTTENPVTLHFAESVIKKPLKIKHQKKPKPKNIQYWIETIFACSTSEAFMNVFYDICKLQGNPQVELVEKLTTWVHDHPQYKTEILQKLQKQPDIYGKYINEWIVLPQEKPAITPIEIKTAPDNKPAVSTPANPAITCPQLPENQDKQTHNHITMAPIEKMMNRKLYLFYVGLQPITGCLNNILWYINNQITNKSALFNDDLRQFADLVKQLEYMKGYEIICNTYSWFINTCNTDNAVPHSLTNNVPRMKIYMLNFHKMISELELQMSQLQTIMNSTSVPLTEFTTQQKSLEQLKNILNNFHRIRKKMNDALRNKGTNFIFALHPVVIDTLFTKLLTMSKECLLTGSTVRTTYENEQNILGTKKNILSSDLDFVLGGADQEKLIAWGFVKNPYLTNILEKLFFTSITTLSVSLEIPKSAYNKTLPYYSGL